MRRRLRSGCEDEEVRRALPPFLTCKNETKAGSSYSKVGDWDFEDSFGPMEDPVEEKRPLVSRVTVLKHMFTPQELKDDPSLLLELKENVREEAENLGDVTNVMLYDVSSDLSRSDVQLTYPQLEPEGMVTVKFRDPISAQACVLVRVLPSALGKEVILNDECRAEIEWALFCWTED